MATSNHGWGLHLRRCGGATAIQVDATRKTETIGGPQSRNNHISGFFESNNFRGGDQSAIPPLGVRQFKIEQSVAIELRGSTGWDSNKADVDWGTRVSCDMQEDLQTLPTFDPIYDLNNEDEDEGTGDEYKFEIIQGTEDLDNNNCHAKWVDLYRPGVIVEEDPTLPGVGTYWTIQYGPTSFDNTQGDKDEEAYWRPWGLRTDEFTPEPGDCYIYEIVLGADSAGYNWCLEREGMLSPRESSIIYVQIAPAAAGRNLVGIYSGNDITVRGRVFIEDVPVTIPTPELVLWSKGFENDLQKEIKDRLDQPSMKVYVRSLRFWGIRADGTPIKGRAGDG